MCVHRLAIAFWVVLLAGSGANAQNPEACSNAFWKRAETVASGHGTNFEIEARQIGRARCDCIFVIGKRKSCTSMVVPESEALKDLVFGEVDR